MTDTHMMLLAWLVDHEGAPLATAAAALGLEITEVERLVNDLVDAEMIERSLVQ